MNHCQNICKYIFRSHSVSQCTVVTFFPPQKMGFDIYVAESAVRKHKTIQASVDAILSGKGMCQNKYSVYMQ